MQLQYNSYMSYAHRKHLKKVIVSPGRQTYDTHLLNLTYDGALNIETYLS
jgi:hypothetical protein